ncbi:hypothetical protein SUDANB95_01710 [Actinosynnema sp. ALI-1.44]
MKLDDHPRRAVDLARARAAQLRHRRVGTEHLLVGLVEEDLGLAAQVLTSAGLTTSSCVDHLAAAGRPGRGAEPGRPALHRTGQPRGGAGRAARGRLVLPPRTRPAVYLSYARPEDLHLAGRLTDHLAEHGVEVVGAVHQADHLLVLVSPQWTLRAPMPDVGPLNLPTFRQVLELRHESFRRDVQRLVEAL